MLTYHNNPAIKEKFQLRFAAHRAADEVVQGTGFRDGRGCFVGCTLDNYDHKQFPIELGWPEWLARLADLIFEGIPSTEAPQFGTDLLAAVPVGVDLTKVDLILAISRYTIQLHRLAGNKEPYAEQCRRVLRSAIDLCENEICDACTTESAASAKAELSALDPAWSAAESAWSEARSKWSAAQSKRLGARCKWLAAPSALSARSAWSARSGWFAEQAHWQSAQSAWSTAQSAWWAARSAWLAALSTQRAFTAAQSAQCAAESAWLATATPELAELAWSAAWQTERDTLLSVLKSMNPVGADCAARLAKMQEHSVLPMHDSRIT